MKKVYDLKERTFNLAEQIIDITSSLPSTIEAEVIRSQLVKSGTSIGANTEEADGAETIPDKIHKFSIARKEARETRFWLKLVAKKYLDHQVVAGDIEECSELIKIFSTLINRLKSG